MDTDEDDKPAKTQSEPISAIQGRVDVVFMVLKKCKFLQENIKILEKEKERLQSRLTDAEHMVSLRITLPTLFKFDIIS